MAQAIGAACIGVETGGVESAALCAAGALVAYRDLSQSGVLEQLVG